MTTHSTHFPEVLINVEEVPSLPSYLLKDYVDGPIHFSMAGTSRSHSETDLCTISTISTLGSAVDGHQDHKLHQVQASSTNETDETPNSPEKNKVGAMLSTDSGYSEELTRDSRPSSSCSLKSALKKFVSFKFFLEISQGFNSTV